MVSNSVDAKLKDGVIKNDVHKQEQTKTIFGNILEESSAGSTSVTTADNGEMQKYLCDLLGVDNSDDKTTFNAKDLKAALLKGGMSEADASKYAAASFPAGKASDVNVVKLKNRLLHVMAGDLDVKYVDHKTGAAKNSKLVNSDANCADCEDIEVSGKPGKGPWTDWQSDISSEKFKKFFKDAPCTTCDEPEQPEQPDVTVTTKPCDEKKKCPDGKPGKDGTPGKDSTVPGPVGPVGPKGNDGADGSDGADGKDGHNGKDGANGKDGKDGKNGKSNWWGLLGLAGLVGLFGLKGGSNKDRYYSSGSNCYTGGYNGGYTGGYSGGYGGGGGYDYSSYGSNNGGFCSSPYGYGNGGYGNYGSYNNGGYGNGYGGYGSGGYGGGYGLSGNTSGGAANVRVAQNNWDTGTYSTPLPNTNPIGWGYGTNGGWNTSNNGNGEYVLPPGSAVTNVASSGNTYYETPVRTRTGTQYVKGIIGTPLRSTDGTHFST